MFYVKQKSSRVALRTFLLFLFSQFRFVISGEKNLVVERVIFFVTDKFFKLFQCHNSDFPLFDLFDEQFAFVIIVLIVDNENGTSVGVAGELITFFNEKSYQRPRVVDVEFFHFI